MKRLLHPRLWLWLLFPLLLGWAWRDVPLERVFLSLNQLSIWQILSLVGLNVGLILLFSVRWWLILRIMGHEVPLWRLTAYRTGGFAVSFLTPGPQFGGEPLQIYALHKRHRIPEPVCYASVFLDKVIELLANFSFLGIAAGVAFLGGVLSTRSVTQVFYLSLLLILLPTVYIVFLSRRRKPISGFIRIFLKPGPYKAGLQRLIQTFETAEGQASEFCATRPFHFLVIWFFSLLVWALVMYEFWLSFNYLGLVLSLSEILFVMVAARLALLLPIPGGMGVLEASQVIAIQLLGFDPAYGAGVMVLARARDFSLALIGVVVLFLVTRPLLHQEFQPDETHPVKQVESGGIG